MSIWNGDSPLGYAPRIIYSTPSFIPVHNKMRLAPNPGGPKLRVPGTEYKKTGFFRPSLASVAGADKLTLRVLRSAVPMPPDFCWQPQDLTATMDQGQCGSCWAHALSSMLGDRISILTNGQTRTALSVQQVMECANYKEAIAVGCEGNECFTAIKSMVDKRIKLCAYNEYVRPYDAKNIDPKNCVMAADDKYYAVAVAAFLINEKVGSPGDEANKRNVENMKQHIYFEGPIFANMQVYSDFHDYDGTSIYQPSSAALQAGNPGLHCVEIIGWGTDPASKAMYWVCRNSWGTAWPHNHKKCAGTGTFYMLAGVNNCDIETWCAGATPQIFHPELAPKDAGGMFPGEAACTETDWHPMKNVTAAANRSTLIIGGVAAAVALLGVGLLVYWVIKKKEK